MSTIFTTEIGVFNNLSGNNIQTTGAASFENINFNYKISGNSGIFNDNVFIDDKEVSTKEYVNQEISSLHSIDLSISGDISSLAVRDTGFYNQITGLLGEDLDFGTDVSSLNAKDVELDADVSSLNFQTESFFNSSNNELFSTSGTFSQTLTLNGEPVLTGSIDGNIDWKTIPATSTSAGQEGEVAYDSGYMYVCITNNNWRRLAISDF